MTSQVNFSGLYFKGKMMGKANERKYGEELYADIDIENLILFGMYLILAKGETCTFERIIAECFLQFPKVFAFKRYPQWPDSVKFDRPLRKLREKGLIVGTVKDHFSLTEFGRQKALETKRILEKVDIVKKKKGKKSVGRSADDRLIEYLKSSKSFRDFINDPTKLSISEPEFRNLLRCTLETPLRILKQNLEYYKKVAQSYNEKQLLDFLFLCEKQFIKGGKNG